MSKQKYLKNIDPFFPVLDALDKKESKGKNRNWGYKPTIEEISKECDYLLNLKWK